MMRRCAREQKFLVEALGKDKSTISRQCSGAPSVASRFFEMVGDLANYPHTDPAPLLSHAHVVAAREISREHGPLIDQLLDRALNNEALAQAPADVAVMDYYRGKLTLHQLRSLLVDHSAALIRAITMVDAKALQDERSSQDQLAA